MQLYLRPFYNILRQQNNFDWTTEHQKRFEEIKTLLTEQLSNTTPDPDQPFYAMLGKSTFKPIPYSSWIKNNTQQKPVNQKLYYKNLFSLGNKKSH